MPEALRLAWLRCRLARFADGRAPACVRAVCARPARAGVPARDALPAGAQAQRGALQDAPPADSEQDEVRDVWSRDGWAQVWFLAWLQDDLARGDSVRALLLQVAMARRVARAGSLQAGEQAPIRGELLRAQAAPPRANCAESAAPQGARPDRQQRRASRRTSPDGHGSLPQTVRGSGSQRASFEPASAWAERAARAARQAQPVAGAPGYRRDRH